MELDHHSSSCASARENDHHYDPWTRTWTWLFHSRKGRKLLRASHRTTAKTLQLPGLHFWAGILETKRGHVRRKWWHRKISRRDIVTDASVGVGFAHNTPSLSFSLRRQENQLRNSFDWGCVVCYKASYTIKRCARLEGDTDQHRKTLEPPASEFWVLWEWRGGVPVLGRAPPPDRRALQQNTMNTGIRYPGDPRH